MLDKATNTHSERVILTAFPRQQLLHENTHTHCAYTIQGDHKCEMIAECGSYRLNVFKRLY